MAAAVTTDEIYKRYLDKAIREILRLEHEVAEAVGRGAGRPADRPSARDDLPAQVRPAGLRAAGGRRLPRPRRARPQALARAAASRSARGVRDELRQVRRRRRGRSAARWLERELRIVQPRLVVVMGEDALRVPERARVPALAAARALRWASSSGSPRRSRRWSSPTSTSHSTSSPRRHAFGTPSSPSAPGGPSCRPTRRSSRALVAWYEIAPAPLARSRPGRASLLVALVLMPAMFALAWLALPLWRAAEPARDRRSRVADRRVARLLAARGPRLANFAKFAARQRRSAGSSCRLFEALSWVVAVALDHPLGRRLLGLARADQGDHRRTTRRSSRRSRSPSSCPAAARRASGFPTSCSSRSSSAASVRFGLRPLWTWLAMTAGLGVDDRADDGLGDRRAAGAAGDLARLPAPERRPDLAAARSSAVGPRSSASDG